MLQLVGEELQDYKAYQKQKAQSPEVFYLVQEHKSPLEYQNDSPYAYILS